MNNSVDKHGRPCAQKSIRAYVNGLLSEDQLTPQLQNIICKCRENFDWCRVGLRLRFLVGERPSCRAEGGVWHALVRPKPTAWALAINAGGVVGLVTHTLAEAWTPQLAQKMY